ncbi:glycosyl hydrolase [Aspergillus caelatus]|uniref:Glycosyl hydrolase n=1 Tax=Aspergillus caelatus TaxID=61420 RepID=A0A5N7AI70_9EURO|nr:glycosyl hydrolase [Aspergillus caelatus]KAE8369383.1 glycosyl hydrolase [Aspergillus caelatus]
MVSSFMLLFTSLAAVKVTWGSVAQNQTSYNPAIPGWYSDPSCVFVPEWNNTTFCTASTFLLTPGLPVYASKDLVTWKLASHALSRESQFPGFNQSLAQSDGIWAPTIRYHQGFFYINVIYKNNILNNIIGLVFKTADPYSDSAWSDPVHYDPISIDPDLFWDDDGVVYVATAGTYLQTIDLKTGTVGQPQQIWNGTTGIFLEGPHLYKKDGYYFLMTAEGGSGMNHSVTIARSRNIWGPYESCPQNPVLTNRNTSEYFQNIGHADLFHDARGHWWSSALAWRSGPEGQTYPMGREMVLTPVTWKEGEWPVFLPVRGIETGWYLPLSKDIRGDGPFVNDPDVVDFQPNSTIPRHFGFWRWPNKKSFVLSPPGHPGTLQLTPSVASITAGYKNYTAGYQLADLTLIMRRQTDTMFEYSIDIDFAPKTRDEEVGVTVFLNQVQNINLGVVMLPANDTSNSTKRVLAPHFRFLVSGLESNEKKIPPPYITPVPTSWLHEPIRLMIRASNETHYTLSAASTTRPNEIQMIGQAPATIVSGGAGPFTGSLVGVYATNNGGTGTTPSYISRWRYQGIGQAITKGQYEMTL